MLLVEVKSTPKEAKKVLYAMAALAKIFAVLCVLGIVAAQQARPTQTCTFTIGGGGQVTLYIYFDAASLQAKYVMVARSLTPVGMLATYGKPTDSSYLLVATPLGQYDPDIGGALLGYFTLPKGTLLNVYNDRNTGDGPPCLLQ